MALEDRTVGFVLVTVATVVFSYYTVWTLVLPFVDEDHAMKRYFPDVYYALAIPLLLLVVGLAAIVALIALVTIKAGRSKIPVKKTE